MIIKLKDYNLGKCYIGSISLSRDVDVSLAKKGLNIIHYGDGMLTLVNECASFSVEEMSYPFFDALCDYDVIEIFDNGVVRLQFAENAEDNTLFITSKCNSNCVMCPSSDYSRRKGVIPEIDEVMELVRHCPNSVKHITITGGEPFLFRDSIFRVLASLRESFFETEFLILTNGRVFCLDKYVDLLIQTRPRYTTLAIPVHGSTATKHDAITRAEGSFSQTISGISKLLAGGVPVELRVVVSQRNIDDLFDIAQMIIDKFPTVYSVHFIGLEMLGNAAINNESVWVPYHTAFFMSRKAADLLINAGINVAFYNFPLCAVEPSYWTLCKKSISKYKRDFPADCQMCSKNKLCGGVFSGSLRYAITDLHPFEE